MTVAIEGLEASPGNALMEAMGGFSLPEETVLFDDGADTEENGNGNVLALEDVAVPRRDDPKTLARKYSSALAISDDPFAARDGKTLLWRNINMKLKAVKDGEEDRFLLNNVWGEVPEGNTTAIMGPSGAGKTSLLNILAGRAKTGGRLIIESDVRLNNFAVDPTHIRVRKQMAFVAQDDSLQVTATPREAIYFSAKLRLPAATPEKNLVKLTNRMLSELGLESCADTYVGGDLLKGISGGERKRTSVGVELVVRPAMVFLDEPTSGLDSFSALKLCDVLKKVANAGSSVLFTIHQPSSEIFNSFDHLILMNKGLVMYNGLVSDVSDYFGERGQALPPKYNPADWIMQVAQSVPLDELDEADFFTKDNRELPDPITDHIEGKDDLGITLNSVVEDADTAPVGFATQTQILFSRELRNIVRDTASVGARFGSSIVMSILIGIIFWDVGQANSSEPAELNSQFGALIMVLMMGMFGTAQSALLSFPEERPVFLREYSTNHYSVASYFMSRLTMEALITAAQILCVSIIGYFCISFNSNFGMFYLEMYALAMTSTAMATYLGCSVEDPKMAQEMMPILFVPQMLFAGFFVTPDLIPEWLRWARYLWSLTYTIRIALLEEFGDGCGSPEGDYACERLLQNVGAEENETWWYWLVLLLLFCFFRLLALFILRSKATKFY